MKIYWSILFVVIISFSFSQDDNEVKAFKKSTNKYYIGASVSPIFVSILGAESIEPEWRLSYKQRLGANNHYFRFSYNYTGKPRQANFALEPFNYFYDQTTTLAIDTNLYWRSGLRKYHDNQHFFKLGYEYQFKIGKQRNISVNLGMDGIMGIIGGPLFAVNDTFRYETVDFGGGGFYEYEEIVSLDRTKVEGPQFATGLSPFVAVGFPIKKHFDLTFEMNYDIHFSKSILGSVNAPHINSLSIDYRPSLILSYRFDEAQVRKENRQSKSSR